MPLWSYSPLLSHYNVYIYVVYTIIIYHILSIMASHFLYPSSHGIPSIPIPALHSSHQNVAWHEGLRGLRGLAAPAQRRPGVQRCVPGDGRDVRHLEGMGWLWSVLHGFHMLSLGFYMVTISYHMLWFIVGLNNICGFHMVFTIEKGDIWLIKDG